MLYIVSGNKIIIMWIQCIKHLFLNQCPLYAVVSVLHLSFITVHIQNKLTLESDAKICVLCLHDLLTFFFFFSYSLIEFSCSV